jgi:hypothetical protein
LGREYVKKNNEEKQRGNYGQKHYGRAEWAYGTVLIDFDNVINNLDGPACAAYRFPFDAIARNWDTLIWLLREPKKPAGDECVTTR